MADFLAGRPQNQSIGAGLREYLNTENSDPGTAQRFLGNLFGNASELAGLDQQSITMRNLEDDYINNYYKYMMQTGSKEAADAEFPSAADLMIRRSTEMMPMGSVGGKMPRKGYQSPATPDAIIKQSPNPNLLPDFDVRAKRMQSPKYERPEIPPEKIPQKFPDEGDMIPGFGQPYNTNMLKDMKGNVIGGYVEPERIRWDRLTKEKIEQLRDMGYTDKYIEFKKFQAEKEAFANKIRNIATGTGIAGITAFGVNELGNYLAQGADATATIPQSEPINLGTLYSDTATMDTTQQPLFSQYGNGGDSSMYNINRALDSADQSHRLQGGIGNVPVDQLLGYDSLLQRRKNLRGF